MVSIQQSMSAKETGKAKAAKSPGAAIMNAFKFDSDSQVMRNFVLGNAGLAMVKKGYSNGSQFDDIFTNESASEMGSQKVLHLIVTHDGFIDYSRLGCDKVSLYTFESLDKVKDGPRMRRRIEEMISSYTKHIKAKADTVWKASLFASFNKDSQSILVLRFNSDILPGSETSQAEAVFFVVPTSERVRKDAIGLANDMKEGEGHPGTWIVMSSKGYVKGKAESDGKSE